VNNRLNIKSKPAKRGMLVRVLLCLADRQVHEVAEFYNYVAEALSPQIAVKAYLRGGGHSDGRKYTANEFRRKAADNDPEMAQAEGCRVEVMRCVKNGEKRGLLSVAWPDREKRNERGHSGFLDIKKAMVSLTDDGWKHLLTGEGIYAKVVAELYLGLAASKLKLFVKYSPEDK
jgi:hypothetical protein